MGSLSRNQDRPINEQVRDVGNTLRARDQALTGPPGQIDELVQRVRGNITGNGTPNLPPPMSTGTTPPVGPAFGPNYIPPPFAQQAIVNPVMSGNMTVADAIRAIRQYQMGLGG